MNVKQWISLHFLYFVWLDTIPHCFCAVSWAQVAGHFTGETPHMISAAAKGLARLAYEFSDLVLTSFKLLPGTLTLLRSDNKEIIKVYFLVYLLVKCIAD